MFSFKSNKLQSLLNTHQIKLKLLVHSLCLVIIVNQYYLAFSDQLGADPVESILHFTGISALNLLLLTLLISPVAKSFKLGALIKFRRLMGLWSFVYALSHLISFVAFELQFDWQLLGAEIIDRPYITVGFGAFVILLLLAITSFKFLQRKMGKTWQKLHNWIYPAALLIALHFIWSVKSDLTEPFIYWSILLFLLYFRKDTFIARFKKYKNSTKRLA